MAGIAGTEWTAEMEAEIRAIAEREMPEDMTAEDKKVVREARKKMKEIEKAKKKERKAAAAAAAVSLAESARVDDVEYLDSSKEPEQVYGDYKLIQSRCAKTGSGRKFTKVEALDASQIGKQLWIRARLHNVRAVAKNAFLILRQKTSSAQAVLSPSDTIPREMIKWALRNITTESVIDVQGQIVASEVKSCTQNAIEIAVQRLYVVSKAAQPLPFLPDDAARPAQEEGVHVDRKTRLDARIVDLRVQAHQAIFRIQSGVCQLFREFLDGHGFTEIHSPKLIAGASEGGANVFHLEYFKNPACLAQSPQLYKQMAICGDMERVFEIGPVFRAENSDTHRHLCEFTGLDFEMAIDEHYYEVLRMIDGCFTAIFDGLSSRYAAEIEAVQRQYPFEPFKYRPSGENLVIQFPEGIAMLRESGVEIGDFDDLDTESERKLGELVKAKYDTDFFLMPRYPSAIRPFYTMPDPEDPRYSNSFDVFMRGEEILSGAQRVHDMKILEEKIKALGIEVETVRDYIDAFKFGAPPHGGCGVGLERVVMLFLSVGNIRETSMFPRDPNRLTP
ncbi:hypothetical protein NDN08_004296 [Rhodosorus marinus]|uniref:aspartate--tRNA ligase n=1 Tax=Rhodosorus marinus TaxID=101924 RepID=A0AAV8UKZ8_9RHOD|nr:hypothetical protein NDN08_004296 [Rhodosorus marinus]